MTATLSTTAELERILPGGERMARPVRPLGEGSTPGTRDPRPSWDWWYQQPMTVRRQLLRFMAPAGAGLQPDDVAQVIGVGSIDDAFERWAAACQMARTGDLAPIDVESWEWSDAQSQADAELYGPAELAARWGISVPALHQRRHRGQCPAEDLVLSRVPIWCGETIRIWEETQS